MALVLGRVSCLGLGRWRSLWLWEASGTEGIKEEGIANVKKPPSVTLGEEGVEGTVYCLSGFGKVQ